MYTPAAIVPRGEALVIDCMENYLDTWEGLDPMERLKKFPLPGIEDQCRCTDPCD
jgi:hypothetical protein